MCWWGMGEGHLTPNWGQVWRKNLGRWTGSVSFSGGGAGVVGGEAAVGGSGGQSQEGAEGKTMHGARPGDTTFSQEPRRVGLFVNGFPRRGSPAARPTPLKAPSLRKKT